jgi:uncharacterized membrane protein YkgB
VGVMQIHNQNLMFKNINLPLSRFAIFLVYFWFGILKVFSLSPAGAMVLELLHRTMPFFPPNQFMILFGLLEVLIGLLFLWPKVTKIALSLLVLHLVTTIMPLFIMPEFTWSRFLIPTLEGQYIIKNILIIALGVNIASTLTDKKLT